MLIANTLNGRLNSQHSTNLSWIVTTIKAKMIISIQKFEKPIFSFKRTHEAEVRKIKILAAFKGDLGAAIAAHKYSPVNYGSEFCDTTALSKLFLHHEGKNKIINIIKHGSCYHLNPIKEEKRKSDIDTTIIMGNHKSLLISNQCSCTKQSHKQRD